MSALCAWAFAADGQPVDDGPQPLPSADALCAFLEQRVRALPPQAMVLLRAAGEHAADTAAVTAEQHAVVQHFAASGDEGWDLQRTSPRYAGPLVDALHDVAAFHATRRRVAGSPAVLAGASALIMRAHLVPAGWAAHAVFESADAVMAELSLLWYRAARRVRVAPLASRMDGTGAALSLADQCRLLRRHFARADQLLAMGAQLWGKRAWRSAVAWMHTAGTPPMPVLPTPLFSPAIFTAPRAEVADHEAERVTVVLPTRGRYPYLAEILGDVRAQTVRVHEVIVGDANEEGDRELGFYEAFADLPLRVVWLAPHQRGVSSARNACLALATGTHVWFLDDDSRVQPDNLEQHVQLLRSGAADVSVGPATTRARPTLLREQGQFGSARMDCGTTLCPLALIERVGAFDAAFDAWVQGEDADLGDRFVLTGARLVNNPQASRFHYLAPVGGTRSRRAAAHRWQRWALSPRPSPAVYYRLKKNFGGRTAAAGTFIAAVLFGFRRRQLEGQRQASRLSTVGQELLAAPLTLWRLRRSVREAWRAINRLLEERAALATLGSAAPPSAAREASMGVTHRLTQVQALGRAVMALWRLRAAIRRSEEPYVVFLTPWLAGAAGDGAYVDRVGDGVHERPPLYVNYSKTEVMRSVNGEPVYNVGALLLVLQRWRRAGESATAAGIRAARTLQRVAIGGAVNGTAVTYCHYDFNGLALATASWRSTWRMVEVQHGSVVGYAPYAEPSGQTLMDQFVARDVRDSDYVHAHLLRAFPCGTRIVPRAPLGPFELSSPCLLYISTPEINGLHPVFRELLQQPIAHAYNIIVRPHPREHHLRGTFASALTMAGVTGAVSSNAHWQADVRSLNTVVMSPWSSVLEEAVAYGLGVIVIDPSGVARFSGFVEQGLMAAATDVNTAALSLTRLLRKRG